MFTVFIIALIIATVLVTLCFIEDEETGIGALAFALLILTVLFFMSFRWQIGEANYTGYIYSRDSRLGYTTYHIRFSQNAGEDNQPSFTVKAGSEEEAKLDKLVGAEKKVLIFVPSEAPKMVQNIFEPGSFAQLKEIVEKEQ